MTIFGHNTIHLNSFQDQYKLLQDKQRLNMTIAILNLFLTYQSNKQMIKYEINSH
jgi:hypothetical protein